MRPRATAAVVGVHLSDWPTRMENAAMPNPIESYHESQDAAEPAEVLALFLEDSEGFNVSLFEVDGEHELHRESGDHRPNVVVRIMDRETREPPLQSWRDRPSML